MNYQLATTALLVTFLAAFNSHGNASTLSDRLTIDRLFHDKEFELNEPVPSKWLGNGDQYTTIVDSQSVANGQDIVQHDAATGEQTILVEAKKLVPDGHEQALEIKDYAWSENGRYLLIQTNTVKFRRYEPLGDYWLLNLET